ncbi:cation:dicarboxylate symporter family transporter [Candidatus Fokinia crypta]|uniref:Sodium:dicarboxylate symporter family protein n=1 Tax=Candidatus Fokinia crypta TaxID=1920990 RepID=A0ABZ0UPF5_9RICK|nr:cation:dicarboxylase symporter family transporter [Candidatus Fokinia cryptica]WPX98006.1 Sodium:dicarboxylate symporter family protein [Candidatus Fokinia cryptica]
MITYLRLRHLKSVLFVLLILGYSYFFSVIPDIIRDIVHTLALHVRNLVMLFIPVLTFTLMANAMYKVQSNATLFVVAIVLLECISNFIAIMYSYFFSAPLLPYFSTAIAYSTTTNSANLLFDARIPIPDFWNSKIFIVLGIIIGRVAKVRRWKDAEKILDKAMHFMTWIMHTFFSKAIIVMIMAFIANFGQKDIVSFIRNLINFLSIALSCSAVYFILILLIPLRMKYEEIKRVLKTITYPVMVAFTSSSSIIALPYVAESAAKLAKFPNIVRSIIPITIGVQQIGDCILNAILFSFLSYQFYGALPSLIVWLEFSFFYVLMRVGMTAVPGGGAISLASVPLLEKYLHFNDDMISIVLMMNILMDEIITALNVGYNIIMSLLMEKILLFYGLIKTDK